jgi:CO/xanthine dehydrogenase FAD-binding subunit
MKIWNQYQKPATVDEALGYLSTAKGSTAVIGGGTDLLLDIRQGRHSAVEVMVDIAGVDEMCTLKLDGEHIVLGASVTHNEIVHSDLLKQNAECVVEGCGLIGGPQVRNVATIGGNVAHALPAGDGTISLLAMNTEVQIASPEGRRWEPLEDIFAGPGKPTFDRAREILVAFRFIKSQQGEASAFHRIMRPQGVAIAILNMAAWVKLDENGSIADVRISVGPAGPRPLRAHQTEAALKGRSYDEAAFQEACKVLDGEVSLRTSAHRATKEYRHKMIPVLLKRVLDTAVSRSKQQG